MAALSNPKHETFAQGIVKGLTLREAYIQAGYDVKSGAVADSAASRLLKDVKIAARVAELQSRVASGIVISRQKTLEELASIGYAPLDHEIVKVADKRAALMDIARLEGWVIERSESGKPGDFSRMSEDELERYIAERARRIGGGPSGARNPASAQTPRPTGRPH